MQPTRLALLCGLVLPVAAPLSAQPTGFPTYAGMVQQMTTAANTYPSICQLVDLTVKYAMPTTAQGNHMYAVKISDNVGQEEDEPAFLMVACHHGNEIGTPIVALDAIQRLTSGYGNDPTVTALVDGHEIWIAPCWNPDGYPNSRTNRRPGGGVNLNRNYPFLWSSPCSGSSSPSSSEYKGPFPASEPETRTLMALSEEQRFTKVLDFHSSGRETLFAYRCTQHQLSAYLQSEAVMLSQASGYGGAVRAPSAEGEQYQWQLGNYSNLAMLTEISNTQTPSITSAQQEAAQLWPGTVFLLQRPVPVAGHVTDATSGAPLEVSISYVENPFTHGERNRSEPLFGRYHAFLPIGKHTLRFSHPCYVTQDVPVTVTATGITMDVQMVRVPNFTQAAAAIRNGSNLNPQCLSSNRPILGQPWVLQVTPTATGALGGAIVATQLPGTGPVLPGLGEILIDAQSMLLFSLGASSESGAATFQLAVPTTASAMGYTGTVQGVVLFGGGAATLCNAVDFTLGCP